MCSQHSILKACADFLLIIIVLGNGCMDLVDWNGGLDWNGGMDWTGMQRPW